MQGRLKAAAHGMLQQIGVKGGNMNRKIYVANLPYQATEPELKTLFSKAGRVISVRIVQDNKNHFAFKESSPKKAKPRRPSGKYF